ELTFDFSDYINPPDGNGTLGQIIIFPDFDNRDQDNVIYFDNITFNPAGSTPSDGPEVPAPTPPAIPPGNVISIFSDAFTNVEGTDFNPDWGQSTQVSIIEIQGNETLKYANFNYQGTQFAQALDVSEMQFLHLDMWTADATSVNVFCISPGPVETAFALPITPNQWVSYDIPLSAFAPVDLTEVIQFKFDGGDGTQTIYLDNLYFYTGEVEEGSDATLSDLQVDGSTVSGFSPSILNYSVVLPEGTTEVPTVTATTNDPEATAVITPASQIPGTTSILVTSANTEVELTYTVAFSLETEGLTGPNYPIDFEPGGFGADWTWTVFENETNPPLEIISNPDPSGINTSANVAKFTALEVGNPWAGVESEQGVDLGTFEWSDDNRIVKIMVWKPIISDVGIKFATETGWAQEELKVSNTLTNEWEELTFDFSDFINPPDGNGTLGQIIIFPDFAEREQDNVIYFDNITFNPVGDTPSDEPDVAAPTPPARNPEDVISVFSEAYTNVEGTNFNPDWGQSTQVSIIEIQGNQTLKYENFNYQGTEFANPLNVTQMETLHLDMWTADATSVNVFLISTGPEETAFVLPITPNQWVSYDIPLSEFAGVDLEDVIQFKFDGGDGTPTLYLDNLYFYRIPTSLSDISQDAFTVYPNPVRSGDIVNLSARAKQVEVFDISGKLIQSFMNTSSVPTDIMNRGVYFMRIQSDNGHVQVSRLIVK
ncbi:MAG: T9SS C-terminal target domain-containing protein, partial [Bacteroidia bacterium]